MWRHLAHQHPGSLPAASHTRPRVGAVIRVNGKIHSPACLPLRRRFPERLDCGQVGSQHSMPIADSPQTCTRPAGLTTRGRLRQGGALGARSSRPGRARDAGRVRSDGQCAAGAADARGRGAALVHGCATGSPGAGFAWAAVSVSHSSSSREVPTSIPESCGRSGSNSGRPPRARHAQNAFSRSFPKRRWAACKARCAGRWQVCGL